MAIAAIVTLVDKDLSFVDQDRSFVNKDLSAMIPDRSFVTKDRSATIPDRSFVNQDLTFVDKDLYDMKFDPHSRLA